jgi:hypothetical protein
MEGVFLLGLMVENTMENISMIKSKVMVFSHGQMEGNMKVIGIMENNMDREFITLQKGRQRRVNGKMEKELDGFLEKEAMNDFYSIQTNKFNLC